MVGPDDGSKSDDELSKEGTSQQAKWDLEASFGEEVASDEALSALVWIRDTFTNLEQSVAPGEDSEHVYTAFARLSVDIIKAATYQQRSNNESFLRNVELENERLLIREQAALQLKRIRYHFWALLLTIPLQILILCFAGYIYTEGRVTTSMLLIGLCSAFTCVFAASTAKRVADISKKMSRDIQKFVNHVRTTAHIGSKE